MEFIRKNIMLVVVLSLTFVASAYLIYMDISMQSKVVTANSSIASIKTQLDDLNSKIPAPIPANLDMIRSDTTVMREKAQELQRLFGKPYRTALQRFAEALGLTENECLAKFRDYCTANPKIVEKYQLLDGFLKTFEDKTPTAMTIFRKTVQDQTLEPIYDGNVKDIMLQAFGMQRTMLPTFCKEYIIKMQELFVANFAPLVTSENISKLTFDYASSVPGAAEVPSIVRRLQLFEDFFRRMKSAGIVQLNSMEILGSPLGDELNRDFVRYSLRIRVGGDMQSIKNFVNLLQDSYKDNRVYSIKDISLQLAIDDASKLVDKSGVATPKVISSVRRPEPQKDVSAEKAKELPPEERPDYGQLLVGDNRLVLADIEIDYFIYVGDEMKR